MSDHDSPRLAYERPCVADYGTLAELTADAGMLMPFGIAGMSGPLVPTPTGGGPDFPGGSGVAGGSEGGFGTTVPELLPTGGELGSGGPGADAPGGSTPAGVEAGGGGGGAGGGTVSTGGGDASLPFTGFPAAMAAAVGAGLAGAGAALRRALRRDKTDL